jgi:hypothetical protein
VIPTDTNKYYKILYYTIKWLEIACLGAVFGVFVFFLFTLNKSCLSGVCSSKFFGETNLYFLTVKLFVPICAILSLSRSCFDFSLNDKEVTTNWFFYVAMFGLMSSFVAFGQEVKDFVYIYAPTEIQPESINVLWVLLLFAFSASLLLNSKRTWDRMTPAVKTRVVFYISTLVFLFNSMNIGVLFFAFGLPVVLLTELWKR